MIKAASGGIAAADDGNLGLPQTTGVTVNKQGSRWAADTSQERWIGIVIPAQQVMIWL